jgi:hypothetical protein
MIAIKKGPIVIIVITATTASVATDLDDKPAAFRVDDAGVDLRLMGSDIVLILLIYGLLDGLSGGDCNTIDG